MKVNFNQAIYYRNSLKYNNQNSQRVMVQENPSSEPLERPSAPLAYYSNVSFHANPDMEFLLKQANRLKCAYSGREMIAPQVAKNVYQSLKKRPNAQSAINLLIHYQQYMHDVESIIFDIFKETPYKGKKDFQDILNEHKADALVRLEEKQLAIINSVDKYIEKMSDPIAQQVRKIQENAKKHIQEKTFNRKSPLRAIKEIRAKDKDLDAVIRVYQTWYKLPTSSKDLDAFIVKYSKEPHENIAKRLISTSVATIEHVQPSSRAGSDSLSNFILVSAEFNNNRHSMPLSEYIMLNDEIDIKKNLQRYIEDVISEVQDRKSPFSEYSWYPDRIEETIATETAGTVHLNTSGLKLTKAQVRGNNYHNKLTEKFNKPQK